MYLTVSFALVPFAHAASFFYSNESAAQIVTMALTFVFMSIFNENVNKQRTNYELEVNLAGDRANWIYRLWPGYTLTDSLKTESLSSLLDLASAHEDTRFYSDPW